MKKFYFLLIMALVPFIFASCVEPEPYSDAKPVIVATLFPQYDFACQIAGDTAEVKLLLPPGVESHTFEPTPNDMADIYNSQLFIYTGDDMEPWAAKLINGAQNKSEVLNITQDISLEDHDEHDDEHDGDARGHDAHVWLNLENAVQMIETLETTLREMYPEHDELYKENAARLKAELISLDNDFKEMIAEAPKDCLVFGGRFAYSYFLEHYGLKYKTAYDSCSTEAEPGIGRIAEIIDFVNENDIKAVYCEEFVNPKVANSICEQTGAELLVFFTCHNVSKTQKDQNISFVDLMKTNLESVRAGLYN